MTPSLKRRLGGAGEKLWEHVSTHWREREPMLTLGSWIHRAVVRFGGRSQSLGTWFLRNEPLLLTIRDLVADEFQASERLSLCVVGCSTGAELYSVLWILRRSRPDLKISAVGFDVSERSVEKAKTGYYRIADPELRRGYFEVRGGAVLPDSLIAEIFDREGRLLRVKRWIADGVQWAVADARDADLVASIGERDVVLANNLIVHMNPRDAEACLESVIRLVKPGGILVCRGVDPDLREQAVRRFGLIPVRQRIEEIHNADPSLDARRDWPWRYWGLEPFDKRRQDRFERYAAIFRTPLHDRDRLNPGERMPETRAMEGRWPVDSSSGARDRT